MNWFTSLISGIAAPVV